jgi:hypothetical protein
MPISRDQLAALNFGYLKGSDLLQFCPAQLLTSQYDKNPECYQTGCEQAYDEIRADLCNRYDIDKEFSNANQKYLNQTGLKTVVISEKSYIPRIILTWNNPLPLPNNGNVISLSSPIIDYNPLFDNSPIVKIGTTNGGEEIMKQDNIQYSKVLWVNKLFDNVSTLYILITGGNVDIDLVCNTVDVERLSRRNPAMVKISSIFAIRNILGSISGENKMLISHFEWADLFILSLKEHNKSLPLESVPISIASKAYTINSSFKTLG